MICIEVRKDRKVLETWHVSKIDLAKKVARHRVMDLNRQKGFSQLGVIYHVHSPYLWLEFTEEQGFLAICEY